MNSLALLATIFSTIAVAALALALWCAARLESLSRRVSRTLDLAERAQRSALDAHGSAISALKLLVQLTEKKP